jgi:hypothetical protein
VGVVYSPVIGKIQPMWYFLVINLQYRFYRIYVFESSDFHDSVSHQFPFTSRQIDEIPNTTPVSSAFSRNSNDKIQRFLQGSFQ